MAEAKQIPVTNRYSEQFRRFYVTGAFGGFNGYDLRIAFYQDNLIHAEQPKTPPTAVREIHAEIILSPPAAKQLRDWLDRHVKEIERLQGEMVKPGARKEPAPTTQDLPPYG